MHIHVSTSADGIPCYTTTTRTTTMMLHLHPAKPPSSFQSPLHSSPSCRVKMSSGASPSLPENRVVLGLGTVTLDFLAAVASYPKPDDKIRSTSSKAQGGGNVGNALACAARLGLNPRLISKVADDSQGKGILEELEADGVDSSFVVSWTDVPSIPSALAAMLLKLPNLKFVVVTLGEDGCIMLERSTGGTENVQSEEVDVDDLLETLKQKRDCSKTIPICVASSESKMSAKGIGTVHGRLLFGTAEKIPSSEIVDTTGAGDSFIGAVLYTLCANMPPEKMLPFASQVAGIGCRALGARTGLPYRTDSRLASFLV